MANLLLAAFVASAAYSILLFCKICFGTVDYQYISCYYDLSSDEVAFLGLLLAAVLVVGIDPTLIFDKIGMSCARLDFIAAVRAL